MSTPPPRPPSLNLAEYLIGRNAARGERTAYIDDHGSLTYGELAQRIRQCASVLRERGLRREERVLLLANDSIDWPVAFLGAIDAGVVPVAVNTLDEKSETPILPRKLPNKGVSLRRWRRWWRCRRSAYWSHTLYSDAVSAIGSIGIDLIGFPAASYRTVASFILT